MSRKERKYEICVQQEFTAVARGGKEVFRSVVPAR